MPRSAVTSAARLGVFGSGSVYGRHTGRVPILALYRCPSARRSDPRTCSGTEEVDGRL